MSPNIENTLRHWITYYAQSRRSGHTMSAINGVKKTDAFLVTHDHAFGETVGVKTLPYNEDEKLLGLRAAVVWDNRAIIEVFIYSARRIEGLKGEVYKLEMALIDAKRPKPTYWQMFKARWTGRARRTLLWFRGGLS